MPVPTFARPNPYGIRALCRWWQQRAVATNTTNTNNRAAFERANVRASAVLTSVLHALVDTLLTNHTASLGREGIYFKLTCVCV